MSWRLAGRLVGPRDGFPGGGGVTAEEGPIAAGDWEWGEERAAAASTVFSRGRGEEEVWDGETDCKEGKMGERVGRKKMGERGTKEGKC